jgi:hypothetical protein
MKYLKLFENYEGDIIKGIKDIEVTQSINFGNELNNKEKNLIKIGPPYLTNSVKKDDGYYYCGNVRCLKIKHVPLIIGLSFTQGEGFLEECDEFYCPYNIEYNGTYRFQTEVNSSKIDKTFDNENDLMAYMILCHIVYICYPSYIYDIGKGTIKDVIDYTDLKLENDDIVYKAIKEICKDNQWDDCLEILNNKILKK